MEISTHESFAGGWMNGSISFQTIDELKAELKAQGKQTVCLYEWQGAYDDSPNCVAGNIKVDNLNETIVNWVDEDPRRYLGI